MNSLMINARASKAWFDDDNMWVALEDGRLMAVPKIWFPRLAAASEQDLTDYEMIGNGIGLHWEKLDEDISVPNLLMGYGMLRRTGNIKK